MRDPALRAPLHRVQRLRTVACLLLVVAFPACGGGGDDAEPSCQKPGTLRALAVQGEPAPQTAGSFGAMAAAGLPMDVAENGWAVFVAPTTDPVKTSALFVARPDGVVLLVYAVGDVVPDAGGGTISGFSTQPLEVSSDGRILCRVSITGDAGGRTFGLLSARVNGVAGAVIDRNDVLYHTRDMAPTVTGTLTSIVDAGTFQADDGTVFVLGATSSAIEAFWSVEADGTGLTALVVEGGALPGAETVESIQATGIDAAGTRFAVVVERAGGPGAAIYSGEPAGALSFLAGDGQALTAPTGGGVIAEVHEGGPLLVYPSGAVVWQGRGSLVAPDDVLFLQAPGAQGSVLARSDQPAPGTNNGVLTEINLLNCAREAGTPMFSTEAVSPTAQGFVVYGFVGNLLLPVLGEGRAAPGSAGGGTITDTFPGLRVPGRDDVAKDGGFVFANLLSTGKSAVLWLVPGCGLFTLAVSDGAAPGGDTFGAFSPAAAQTTANQVVLFRAPLTTAGSGIFRQGP